MRNAPSMDRYRLVAQLSRWLANQGCEADDLSSVLLKEFLHARREAGHKTRSQLAYAPLLKHLRQIGVLSEPVFRPSQRHRHVAGRLPAISG